MTVKIDKKIVGYAVVDNESKKAQGDNAGASQDGAAADDQTANVVHMHEKLQRPEMLLGSTYKIKTPLSEHALYVTINDVVLNQGTEHERRRPFEIFINSKNMDHFQWIVALTRIISAVFRKGGDATFLVEELRSVFDPRGGYFKKGGKYIPSLVGEIGDAIECHMKMIGMIKADELDDCVRQHIEDKRAEYDAMSSGKAREQASDDDTDSSFPPDAQMCQKCTTKAVIKMDGCMTCLNCGESKCG
jgi:hypothetical protein